MNFLVIAALSSSPLCRPSCYDENHYDEVVTRIGSSHPALALLSNKTRDRNRERERERETERGEARVSHLTREPLRLRKSETMNAETPQTIVVNARKGAHRQTLGCGHRPGGVGISYVKGWGSPARSGGCLDLLVCAIRITTR